MARVVKPTDIKTLKDWVARWPKTQNLEFDAETREPSIYTAVKRGDPSRTLVSKIPWKREGDTLAILSEPSQFSSAAVEAARRRYAQFRTNQNQVGAAAEEQLRLQEATLLAAWRDYRAAPPAIRSTLMRDILTAERALSDMERALAEQLNKERVVATLPGEVYAIYNPPVPVRSRAIALAELSE
jgi:hypothetical protein